MGTRYLTIPEVITINAMVTRKYSPNGLFGVRSFPLLESAVYRPQQSVLAKDAYPTVFAEAAALFASIGQNHPFYNANKRTAFTAMVVFLRYNGYRFTMPPKEAEDFTVAMVEHQYSFQQVESIIANACKAV
ncbi:toxin Doc [Peptococcaceae bacterium CEB3]|nr:toxin Doc [Peptococcaceae bacterium CEB3]